MKKKEVCGVTVFFRFVNNFSTSPLRRFCFFSNSNKNSICNRMFINVYKKTKCQNGGAGKKRRPIERKENVNVGSVLTAYRWVFSFLNFDRALQDERNTWQFHWQKTGTTKRAKKTNNAATL